MSSMRVRRNLVFVQEDQISFYLFPAQPQRSALQWIFVVQVRDALSVGDHVGAMNASRSARSLSMIGIVIGFIVIVIVIVMVASIV